jgi:molecular chaperone GrpE
VQAISQKRREADMTKQPDVAELQLEIDNLTEALQRERADAMNLRRRFEEEKGALGLTHKISIISELLPVIDNFDRSLNHVPQNLKDDQYIKGINSIVRQFEDALSKLGVTKIKAIGENFDPNLHEAISHQEDGDKEVVTEEIQTGYMLGDRVIRHSIVKVN